MAEPRFPGSKAGDVFASAEAVTIMALEAAGFSPQDSSLTRWVRQTTIGTMPFARQHVEPWRLEMSAETSVSFGRYRGAPRIQVQLSFSTFGSGKLCDAGSAAGLCFLNDAAAGDAAFEAPMGVATPFILTAADCTSESLEAAGFEWLGHVTKSGRVMSDEWRRETTVDSMPSLLQAIENTYGPSRHDDFIATTRIADGSIRMHVELTYITRPLVALSSPLGLAMLNEAARGLTPGQIDRPSERS